MNSDEAKAKAIEVIQEQTDTDGPSQCRILHCHGEAAWYPDMLCTWSEHELSILAPGPDIIVFFDQNGKVCGWRDDGRRGSRNIALIDPEPLRNALVGELGLPEDTRLMRVRPVELPPLGWTHEAILWLAPVPRPDQILRIWAAPENLRVIQCLYGPPPSREDRP